MNDTTTAGIRTSDSNPSLKPISNRTESIRSTGSRLGSYRHALLRSNTQQQQAAEKDLPVPPVLTHNEQTPKNENIGKDSDPQDLPSQTPLSIESLTRTAEPIFTSQRLPVAKVRPAVSDMEEGGKLVDEGSTVIPKFSGEAYSVEKHFQHTHSGTPKVRPFVEQPSVPDPQSHEGRSKEPSVVNQHRAEGSTLGSQGVGALSHASSQISVTGVESAHPEPETKLENFRQRDQANQRDSSASKSHTESRGVPSISGKGSERSIAAMSPEPPSGLAANSAGNEDHPELDKKVTTRRTTGWLRGLLGLSDADASPNLTKLPEKPSPRKRSSDDVGSVVSGVTTYSYENGEDKKAMNDTMHSLETLMTEALSLANEAGVSRYGHVDDGNLSLKRTSENTSVHTPSVHESIRRGSSEHGGVMLAEGNNNANLRHEILSESANRQGLVKSIRQDGKIIRPDSLKKIRNATSTTQNHYHTADDNDVLPMPLQSASDDKGSSESTGAIRPGEILSGKEVREYIKNFHEPPISFRGSSKISRDAKGATHEDGESGPINRLSEIRHLDKSVCSLDGGTSDEAVDFSTQYSGGDKQHPRFPKHRGAYESAKDEKSTKGSKNSRSKGSSRKQNRGLRNVNLRNTSHVSIGEGQFFSLTRSAKRQPTIARDWSPARKRFVAAVACTSTALIGVLIGIYAGLVPSIQYYIADFHHYTILGNVGLYLGMALPNLLFWPLPLLHGRKPYIVGGLCTAMPLLFPQALAIVSPRSPYTCIWRVALLLPRALMGTSLGFASMNFHSTLTDLFGASLMSRNPHQEVVDEYDVRRHGGGLGVWLGIWTWCFIGSLSVGFVIGAVVIEYLEPVWGLHISIIILAVVLLLNVLCPEVRRSAWRRSVAEVRKGETVSRRLARGEVMMHRIQTGPKWWGQEVYHGVALSLEMLRQPGFAIMAIYSAWIYAQAVLVIVLLGSLISKSYRFRSPFVGAVVSSVAIGAFAAIPFQKANLFSRARKTSPLSNTMTFDKKITWTSRLVRRSIFTLVLPVAGIVYTVVSTGPPMHVVFPSIFAALIGFLSCLAISECNGMLMEAWDCSDLQPGMTGRTTSSKDSHKRTNYSSFPRATAGWNFIQSLGFILAAVATAVGGVVTRRLGQRAAAGGVAGILLILSILLLGTLVRFKKVQIIPDCTCSEMDKWTKERRVSHHNWAAAVAAAKEKGTKELNNIPEEDIRKKNKFIDEKAHVNRQAVALARDEFQHSARHSADKIMRSVTKRSIDSKCSHESSDEDFPATREKDTASEGLLAGPSVNPPSGGSEHNPTQSQSQPQQASSHERKDATDPNMSQAVDISPVVDGDHERRRSRSQDHTSQSQNSIGAEAHTKRRHSSGLDDSVILTEASRQDDGAPKGSQGSSRQIGDDSCLGNHTLTDRLSGAEDAENPDTREGKVESTTEEANDSKMDSSEKKTSA
ncbi:hypothetical protein F4777DRAFT_576425 [Nemania sp. FL0916]|nr:hypothetical protein F4777DRAFT_576425 [Nemania sp. FL0916]